MEGVDNSNLVAKLTILLIGVAAAALVVTIYHCITIGWCNHRRSSRPGHLLRPFVPGQEGTPSSIENSMVELIPAHKYEKGMGLVGGDGVCAVCLCEFEEGEELRSLPECMHTYHVPCIDMWLFSHPSCPMCRADATPSPYIQRPSPNSISGNA